MTWYKTGTVSVTNGSPNVTLASGNAQLNIFPDDGFVGPDGRTYAILQVNSATQFVLSQNYKGATASGQDYVIIPTADHIQLRDMLVGVNTLIDNYETISLEAGAGRFQNGTALEPGVRGVSQPATGLVWNGDGTLGISVNGAIVATFDASGIAQVNSALNLKANLSGAAFTGSITSTGEIKAFSGSDGEVHLKGAGIELGKAGRVVAGPAYVDFHSSTNPTDYDARIVAAGGNATTGNGALSVLAKGGVAFDGNVNLPTGRAIGLGEFTDSINVNGYQSFPSQAGKFYIQWGQGTSVAGTGALITLPISFPNGLLHINAAPIGATNGFIISVQNVSTSQIRVFATDLSGSVVGGITFMWMAMGI